MGVSVVAGVEKAMESERAPMALRLFGPLTVTRDGLPVALPASRKVRALIAYLALAPQPVARTRLCELLWDVPNDPRGELRWCLSKARSVLDQPARRRVNAGGETVCLDLVDCFVDAAEVACAAQDGIETLSAERLRALAALFNGDFLDGLEIDRNPAFDGWLTAQRRRFRGWHTAILEHLVRRVPGDEAFSYLDKWLALAPFDPRVHEMLLDALARRGGIREGEEHVAAAVRQFESEGLDPTPVRVAWRAAIARRDAAPRIRAATSVPQPEPEQIVPASPRRASIAVMPFLDRSAVIAVRGGTADALVHDIITRLAKLRSLFVIAQGSVFALHERGVGSEEAGRMLNVDYVVGGALQRQSGRLGVSVELIEARTARMVWTHTYDQKDDDTLLVLDEIGNRIVACIANEIETLERNRAILKAPSSLDAWEAHHRGLWHMYRFNRDDNERAQHFFETAVRLDPTFARAYAGLSFTHFQNAFQNWADRADETARAYETAGQSLMADERDPAAHWAMGRALWLRGSHDQSIGALEQAIELSPNFALGHYTLAFVHSQSGDAKAAIGFADHSRQLSPFDPLLFAMLGARAMALVRLGQYEEAAEWAMKAAARPNAHAQILAIATYCLALAGRRAEAQIYLSTIRKTLPRYGVGDFLTAMHFSADDQALFRQAAKNAGLG